MSKTETPKAVGDDSRPPEPDAQTAVATPPQQSKKHATPAKPQPKPASSQPRVEKALAGKPELPSVGDIVIDRERERREDAEVIAINDLLREQRVTETRYHIKIRKNGHICNLNESELRERFDLAKTRKAAPTPAEED
jgi:hypothetical protein